MECTFNDMSGFPSSTGFCNQWPSKAKYASIAVGADEWVQRDKTGTPEWSILYIDFPNDIDSKPNQVLEGGVRPSC